ncbi:60s acidic ribosomal protein [Gregarina niphandrodes]|uniref:60s acidic ribosomal protein n=1 Tax=Gregarina niphandrodes TaxID=110365 RepID=A0A023B2U7_GRENI|nr:60s acidic ribosomal protein [Gregarina niphandrodes]EZG51804.1 60s acidic ribosomal protein [Gregarina niphandrodes]|eukprot:XP_011131915.1 60s acidic ribosomal protein [Gregarina niphandrodes]
MVKYVAAALLCHYAGKDVSESNVKAICEAAAAEYVAEDAAPFLEKIGEMGVEAAITEGSSKLASVPAGGAAGAPAAAAGAAEAAPAAEEKKEESDEESEDMNFSLFD